MTLMNLDDSTQASSPHLRCWSWTHDPAETEEGYVP